MIMKYYDSQKIKKLITDIAKGAGVPERDALILSDALVEADVHGTYTHGISRVNIYIRRIQRGLTNPRADITVERRRGSVIAVDAGNGLGHVQAYKVLELLIPIAKSTGIAAATIRNSQHFGALSYYCNKAADKDMILFATTNAEPAMAPEGGYQAYFGTNPIAVSIPTGKGYHIKIDLSTSVVARGNIIAASKEGKEIPPGWALDPDGNPTVDVEKALAGTVLTMAGHKGYALALMVEVFSGVLSGAAVGSSIGSMYKNLDRKQDLGHFFCLMDIDAFMDLPVFRKRIDAMIDEIKACKKRPGIEEILIPGERSFRIANKNRERGIPISNATLKELRALCEQYNIPFAL
ncbi:MAG: Ldh family oxidoreductase [Nitrospirae bacterium]|nr:Ldh family oxidoreductase [Nitrospirota bacterium]